MSESDERHGRPYVAETMDGRERRVEVRHAGKQEARQRRLNDNAPLSTAILSGEHHG
ncbi:MAG: hypothetical protein AAGJ86_01540 [Pseudomonadota bacterium]